MSHYPPPPSAHSSPRHCPFLPQGWSKRPLFSPSTPSTHSPLSWAVLAYACILPSDPPSDNLGSLPHLSTPGRTAQWSDQVPSNHSYGLLTRVGLAPPALAHPGLL